MNAEKIGSGPEQPELMPESLIAALGRLLVTPVQPEMDAPAEARTYDIRARLVFVDDARKQYLGAVASGKDGELAEAYLKRSLQRALEALS